MANRVAAMLVFLGIAVAAAAWYASSAGASSQAPIPPELVVNATEVGSGNWVRYLVSIRNVGDVAFEGDVILTGSSGAAAPAAPGVPPPRLPTSVPRLPAHAPDAAYEAHVQVAPRETRTLAITAPDRYSQVEVAQSADGSLAGPPVGIDRSPSTAVAVLTGSQAAAADLQGLPLDDVTVRAASFTTQTFPSSSLGLAAYSAVVIDQFDVQSLSAAQREALRDFVGRGGGLVVAGGPSWRRTLPALPAEIEPLHATGSVTTDVAPLLAMTRAPGSAAVTTATGDLRPGAWAVTAGDAPLIVDGTYGSGTVAVIAFDPAAEIAGGDLARAAWTAALAQALPHRSGSAPGAWTVPAVSFQDAVSFPPLRTASLPSPWLVGPLLLLYLVVVAPLNYLLLRRRLRSPDLLWVTAPLIAVLFTGGFYWLGTGLVGGLHDEQIQVLQLGPSGSVASVDYHRIVFTERGAHELATSVPALAAPLTFDLSNSAAGGCGSSCTLALSGLPSGEEHVVPTLRPLVLERGVVYGGVRILGMASAGRQPLAIAAHLESTGGRIVGEIDNTGERPVHGLVLYSVEQGAYHRTPLASVVLPGARVEVSAQGTGFDGNPDAPVGGAPADAGTRISRAVGAELLAGGGQRAWLVGFTDPIPSRLTVDGAVPATTSTTVFEMPVSVERADGQVSDWATARLVASSGRRGGPGFTDVYDLQLPGRLPSTLRVEYQKAQFGAVEVFDWASGRWSGGPYDDDAADATRAGRNLHPGEIAGVAGGAFDMVRLRVSEPRIAWGAGLFVTS